MFWCKVEKGEGVKLGVTERNLMAVLKLQYSYEPVKLEKRNIFYLDILDIMI
jgi:hypothetical protein